MKLKLGLDLPWGIYASILVLLSIVILIWVNVDSVDVRGIINILYFLLAASIIQGALLIRNGNLDTYKNILNAIWNIETAAAFIYGVYIILEYSDAPHNKTLPFLEWASENIDYFIFIVIFFGVTSIARAGYSVAEIFKSTILKALPTEKNISNLVILKKQNINKNRTQRRKKK